MDMKTFGYLYYKTRGYSREDIIRQAEINAEDFEFFEKNLQDVLKEIEKLRPVAENIGQDFVRLTRYIYERESDQTLGVPRPDAIKVRSGEIISLPAIGTLKMPEMPLAKAIEQRRSVRKYSPVPLKQEELSFLL